MPQRPVIWVSPHLSIAPPVEVEIRHLFPNAPLIKINSNKYPLPKLLRKLERHNPQVVICQVPLTLLKEIARWGRKRNIIVLTPEIKSIAKLNYPAEPIRPSDFVIQGRNGSYYIKRFYGFKWVMDVEIKAKPFGREGG